MRNAAIALLAVPILAAIYVGALLRRSIVSRAVLALGLSAILGAGFIGAGSPSLATATPPSPIVPLTRAAFQYGGCDRRQRASNRSRSISRPR